MEDWKSFSFLYGFLHCKCGLIDADNHLTDWSHTSTVYRFVFEFWFAVDVSNLHIGCHFTRCHSEIWDSSNRNLAWCFMSKTTHWETAVMFTFWQRHRTECALPILSFICSVLFCFLFFCHSSLHGHLRTKHRPQCRWHKSNVLRFVWSVRNEMRAKFLSASFQNS